MKRFATTVATALALVIVLAPAAAVLAQAGKTASQFYMDYRKAFDAAKNINDIIKFMSKDTVKQIEQTPPAEREQMFEMIKMMGTLTNVKIVKETPAANGGATLNVEAIDPDKAKTIGTIQIVKEGSDWKLGKESWSSGK